MNIQITRVVSPVSRKLPASFAKSSAKSFTFSKWQPILVVLVLLLSWFLLPVLLQMADKTAGSIDQSIWLLILLSMISFLLIAALCWWLLQQFSKLLGMHLPSTLVSHFNTLSPWEQLVFYWASFGLLLLGALACLSIVIY